ncbi:TPA: transposase [Klebsiella aerogenes]|nr:transposase [Klebsiella aerogenes]
MKNSRFTEEQIVFALKQAELETSVPEVCGKQGISDATLYRVRSEAKLWYRGRRCIDQSAPGHMRCHDRLHRQDRKDNLHGSLTGRSVRTYQPPVVRLKV